MISRAASPPKPAHNETVCQESGLGIECWGPGHNRDWPVSGGHPATKPWPRLCIWTQFTCWIQWIVFTHGAPTVHCPMALAVTLKSTFQTRAHAAELQCQLKVEIDPAQQHMVRNISSGGNAVRSTRLQSRSDHQHVDAEAACCAPLVSGCHGRQRHACGPQPVQLGVQRPGTEHDSCRMACHHTAADLTGWRTVV